MADEHHADETLERLQRAALRQHAIAGDGYLKVSYEPREPQGDRMSVIRHWWCQNCGAFDGPISDDECNVCAYQHGKGGKVEYLVPSSTTQGAVSALERIVAIADKPTDNYVGDNVNMGCIAREALAATGGQ